MNKIKEKIKKTNYENFEYSLEKNKTIKLINSEINSEKHDKRMEILSYGSLLIYVFRKALK
ncbi:MAG: hypothetical protein ACK4GJ_05185 [bacterium]